MSISSSRYLACRGLVPVAGGDAFEAIDGYARGRDFLLIGPLLAEVFGMTCKETPGRRTTEMAVSLYLRRVGFVRGGRARIDGVRQRVYYRESPTG